MPFQSGENWNGNSKGRIPGTRNKRTQQILDLLQKRGDTDPLDFLSSVVTTPGFEIYSQELKVQAANYLTPYLHSKRGTIPAPRFVEEAIEVPDFASVDEAQAFQKEIARRAAAGELELQASLDISALVGNWIRSRQASVELDLKIMSANGGPAQQTIRIEGGLPPLPGTNVTMPVLPGHENEINGSALPEPLDHAPQEHDSPSPTPRSHTNERSLLPNQHTLHLSWSQLRPQAATLTRCAEQPKSE